MISRDRAIGLSLLAALTILAGAIAPAAAAPAVGADRHCPRATPANSHLFFAPKTDSAADKDRLNGLADGLAKAPQPVCILALIDPDEAVHSKKLALRRVLWLRQSLLARGVPISVIAEEFRMGLPEQSKDDLRQINVIVGR